MLAVLIVAVAIAGYTLTVNPTSNVLGDSTNVSNTLVYRDSGGDFALDALTINSMAASYLHFLPPTETIAAGGTITADACGGIKRITATAARTTDTTNTFAAPAAANAGCAMDVVNISTDAITLDANLLFNGAGAANVVLGSSDTVRVISTGAGGAWFQIGGTGNN